MTKLNCVEDITVPICIYDMDVEEPQAIVGITNRHHKISIDITDGSNGTEMSVEDFIKVLNDFTTELTEKRDPTESIRKSISFLSRKTSRILFF